ncbi:hypothetical protein R1flu_029269 [Riccia fluitans]|uniref:Uncharacterized protein n=1 Tax=Riccia fluitans TaxID=41844 RepID=A0ABD1XRX5_9MARC
MLCSDQGNCPSSYVLFHGLENKGSSYLQVADHFVYSVAAQRVAEYFGSGHGSLGAADSRSKRSFLLVYPLPGFVYKGGERLGLHSMMTTLAAKVATALK